VYVFTLVNHAWTVYSKLIAYDGLTIDYFGVGVAVYDSGNSLLVGAHGDDAKAVNAGNHLLLLLIIVDSRCIS
jgi:hypothetical protein